MNIQTGKFSSLYFVFFMSSAKVCNTTQSCQSSPHYFLRFLSNGFLESTESMFTLYPFSKANGKWYFQYVSVKSLFKYHPTLHSI